MEFEQRTATIRCSSVDCVNTDRMDTVSAAHADNSGPSAAQPISLYDQYRRCCRCQ